MTLDEHAITTAEQHESETLAAALTGLEDVRFEDVTVIVPVSAGRSPRLRRWAQLWAADHQLTRCRVVVLHGAGEQADLASVLEGVPHLRLHALTDRPEPTEDEALAGYDRLFDSVGTPWMVVGGLPRRLSRYALRLKLRIARELSRTAELSLTSSTAVLLPNPNGGHTIPRAYIRYALQRLDAHADPMRGDYLGFLALTTGTPHLEGLDLRADDRQIELFGRVSLGRFNNEQPPPWRYRFAVSGNAAVGVATSAPAAVEQRVDNKGGRRWENVVGRLDLDAIPEGNHRLTIALDTAYPALARTRDLVPRAGVLAPARTILLRAAPGDPSSTDTRYLLHTVRGTQTWITLQRGTGSDARRRWTRAMLRKDARAVLRGREGRRMRAARLVRLATRPFYRGRSIWLIGERADTAQDNGFHLFRHLRQTHPDRTVYYIIDRKSPQYPRVEPLGNVVGHSSLRHRVLMMHASVLANAYSIKHMIPKGWHPSAYTRGLAWRVGAHRVYLKHGVHVSPTAVKRGTGGYDLYLSVNPRESAALRESSGYRDQIVETGMPRYDTLVPGPSTRTILFMPTWRRYLVPKLFGPDAQAQVPFEGSTYQTFVQGLLTSPELHDILTRHDFRLQLLPHYNLRQELENFELTSDRTSLADTTSSSFQDLIRGCDVFVTDYSSVHFDVAYLGTPILYTHFDVEEYESGHAVVSWFDHERDAFGPVVHTLEETLAELESILARGCTRDPAYDERIRAAFTYHDHDNSARVVREIDAMLERSRAGR